MPQLGVCDELLEGLEKGIVIVGLDHEARHTFRDDSCRTGHSGGDCREAGKGSLDQHPGHPFAFGDGGEHEDVCRPQQGRNVFAPTEHLHSGCNSGSSDLCF
jgi:hypothetical protein